MRKRHYREAKTHCDFKGLLNATTTDLAYTRSLPKSAHGHNDY